MKTRERSKTAPGQFGRWALAEGRQAIAEDVGKIHPPSLDQRAGAGH
ncbi:hypothetical protein ACPA9J_24390 [Pseudomonas aeruginosa]